MPHTTITHFPTNGFDHCPLLMDMVSKEAKIPSISDFLIVWWTTLYFQETVKACQDREVEGKNMWGFHQKHKRLSNTLISWSQQDFGEIFQNFNTYEEKVHEAEENYICDQSEYNGTSHYEFNAQYI